MLEVILANIIILIIGSFIIFKSADYLVDSISSYAEKLGLSNYIIGLVVVAMAASMPEMIASLIGALTNDSGIFFGSILGSNMVHMALLVGVLGLLKKKINLECKIIEKSKFLIWLILLLPFILLIDGELNRVDGLLLIIAFITYLLILWKNEGTFGKIKEKVEIRHVYKDIVIFLLGLVALLLGGRYIVLGASNLAKSLELPSFFIAILVIGIGGALPDFAVGIKSVLKKRQEIGIGDIIGSTVIELLLFFGIFALIKPIKLEIAGLINSIIFLVISITIIFILLGGKKITWKEGSLLILIYLLFVGIEALLV